MSTSEIRVDPAVFDGIDAYYQRQRNELSRTMTYLVRHCTLDNAMGLLLSSLQPQYNDARDQMFAAIESFDGAIDGLATNVLDYKAEVIELEESISKEYEELEARVTELENQLAAGGGTGGGTGGGMGGGSGGGMGGGSGGGSGSGSGGGVGGGSGSGSVDPGVQEAEIVKPPEIVDVEEPEIEEPVIDEPETEEPVDEVPVDEVPVDEVPVDEVPVDETPVDELPIDGVPGPETPGSSTTPVINITIDGDNNAVIIGDDGTITINPELLAERQAEEAAQDAAFYERIWEEQAANDPLGRSASELQLAWESREAIPLEEIPAGESALGYGTPVDSRPSLHFDLFLPEFATTAATIGDVR